MADEKNKCPLCGRDADLRSLDYLRGDDAEEVKCSYCGQFAITGSLRATIGKRRDLFPYLAAYIRQANQRGQEVILGTHNWMSFATAHRDTPISKKVTKLLELFAARCKPGFPVGFNEKTDPPLVDASSPNELGWLLEHFIELGYATQVGTWAFTLKPRGWDQLQSAEAGGGISGKCFVAMSFHESLKEAYENGIYLAVKEDCKMDPVRIDVVHHNDKICDRIIAEIRTCQFMVADFTLQRAGVYFEAGFAMGLGRPVIWTCRNDDFDNVHFDTRQYNHIVWDAPGDLRVKLADRIRATIPGVV